MKMSEKMCSKYYV